MCLTIGNIICTIIFALISFYSLRGYTYDKDKKKLTSNGQRLLVLVVIFLVTSIGLIIIKDDADSKILMSGKQENDTLKSQNNTLLLNVQQLKEQLNSTEFYIMANYPPNIEITIEDDLGAFNIFNLRFRNLGVSEIELTELHRNYYFNSEYIIGDGDKGAALMPFKRLKPNSSELYKINFGDQLYTIKSRLKNLAESNNKPENYYRIILRLEVRYKRLVDNREYIENLYYVIIPEKTDNEFIDYRLWDILDSQMHDTEIHTYIRSIRATVNSQLNK